MFIDGMDESSELFIFVIVEVRGEGDFFLLSFISQVFLGILVEGEKKERKKRIIIGLGL